MYQLLKICAGLLDRLSPGSVGALARGLTLLGFRVLGLRRRVVDENISRAFPDMGAGERARLARDSVYHICLTVLEFISPRHSGVDRCVFRDRHFLDEALAGGQGAYILCCHMGNWETMAAAVNQRICPTRVVVKDVGGPATDRFVREKRARIGMQAIDRKGGRLEALRQIKKSLGSGQLVGFVLDQSRPGEPRLPFFNAPAKTNTSLATIRLRYKAPVIPAWCRRTGVGRHEVTFMPPVNLEEAEEGGDREDLVIRHTLRFNRVLEDMIRLNPRQYFWLHRRWK